MTKKKIHIQSYLEEFKYKIIYIIIFNIIFISIIFLFHEQIIYIYLKNVIKINLSFKNFLYNNVLEYIYFIIKNSIIISIFISITLILNYFFFFIKTSYKKKNYKQFIYSIFIILIFNTIIPLYIINQKIIPFIYNNIILLTQHQNTIKMFPEFKIDLFINLLIYTNILFITINIITLFMMNEVNRKKTNIITLILIIIISPPDITIQMLYALIFIILNEFNLILIIILKLYYLKIGANRS